MNRLLVVAATALLAAGALAVALRPAPIGILRPAAMPVAFRGASPEPGLTEALAQRAEAAREAGAAGDYLWQECVDSVGVLSVPLPPDADREWRRDVIDRWANAHGWDHGIYKEGGDVLTPRFRSSFQLKVLPLPADHDAMTPFERAMVSENAGKLLAIAMEYRCPDPDPAWKTAARSFLAMIGAR